MTEARNGYQFRCVVNDGLGNSVTSNAAELSVNVTAARVSLQMHDEVPVEEAEETTEIQENEEITDPVLDMPTVSGGDLVQAVME